MTVLDSGSTSWIPDSQKGWIPIFFFLLDCGFQSLAGFRIPRTGSRIPKPGIPDFKSEKFMDSGILIPLHGVKIGCDLDGNRLQQVELLQLKRVMSSTENSKKLIYL